jgi:hypothetical protein
MTKEEQLITTVCKNGGFSAKLNIVQTLNIRASISATSPICKPLCVMLVYLD